nr:MAG TPA: hypothetical protein [Caudoviricetes sp.]
MLCFQPEKPNRRQYPQNALGLILHPARYLPIASAFNRAKNAT